MKAMDLRNRLEEVIYMMNSNYDPEQWKVKETIDMARYNEAKKIYNEVKNAIDSDSIDWTNSSDEDYEAISQLMERLNRKIDSIDI